MTGNPIDDGTFLEIEALASKMAWESGRILQKHFGRKPEVEYKGKNETDPVTIADKESQAYQKEAISRAYPEHGIVAEEDPDDTESPAPDFIWALDPLDGTTNYLNGLPAYAVSIGVVHRGEPVVGAIYLPWPSQDGGVVLRTRRGGGTWIGEERVLIPPAESTAPGRLSGLPGSFGGYFRVAKGLRGKLGDPRVTGSIAYELVLAARGVFQYIVIGSPRIWDVAAGVLAVTEAGGTVLTRYRGDRGWQPLGRLGPPWEPAAPTIKDLRRPVGPFIAGGPEIAALVAANLRRRRPSPYQMACGLLRRARRRKS